MKTWKQCIENLIWLKKNCPEKIKFKISVHVILLKSAVIRNVG